MTTLLQGLIQLSGHPLVHALGWTLLHFCWQGAAVALVLWCVLGLLGGRSSQARYGAACLALGLMVALPAATFAHVASAEYRARSAMLGSGVVLDANLVLQVDANEPIPPWPARIGMALDRSLPWVLLAWFAGVIVFVGRLNFGLLVARRLKTAGTEVPSPALLHLFEDLRTRLGVERAVALLHSAQVQVPTVIGWLRPVVLLPVSCLTGLSADQIEAVLCHELAHVRRHDYLVSVIQSVIETILFYHPAVWWVSRQVRRERECCCDELAVAVGGDVLAYARALSFLEESRASFPEFVLGANGGVLKMRIKRMLGGKRDAEGSPAAALVALGMIVALAGSYFVSVSRAQAQAAQAQIASIAEPVASVSVSQEGTARTLAPGGASSGVQTAQGPAPPVTDERQDFTYLMPGILEKDGTKVNPPTGVSGTIVDLHGAAVVSAKMTAFNTDTGVKTVTQTDNKGSYSFAALPPGPYLIEMEAKGFSNLPQEKIRVERGQWLGMNVMFSVAAAAQTPAAGPAQEAGSISGVIVDPTGALVARAKVTATNTDDGVQTVRVTDNSGTYSFSLPPGPYNVEVQAKGFQRLLQENVHVVAGQTVGLNLKLTIGAATENLNVTGQPPAPPPPPVAAPVQQQPGRPLRVSAGTIAGMAISQPQPVYPDDAKAQHVQGVVVLHARISKDGTVKDVQVISGPPPLIVSAIDAVRQWKYKPYLLNGEPTEVDTTININYTFGEAADSQGTAPQYLMPGIEVSAGVMAGSLISKVDPVYPEIAKAAHVQGVVVLHAVISKAGDVESLSVISGAPMLTATAIEAVKQWKYKPYLLNGQPTEVETTINVIFTLPGSDSPGAGGGKASTTQTEHADKGATPTRDPSAFQYLMPGIVEKVGGAVSAPILIYKVDPEFTAQARKAKASGTVFVGLIVDKQGLPQNVRVLRGFGIGPDGKPDPKLKKAARATAGGMNQKALDAVSQYKFKPAIEDGKPVPVELHVEVNFQIF
jgi:TonB family protein